jgi:hypothetical protein
MSWQRTHVAKAVAAVLDNATEGNVTTFADPPPSFNVPAYIVAWPTTVSYHTPAYGIDEATLPLIAAVGTEESDKLDHLLGVARDALETDPTLGGVLLHGGVVVTEERNWRVLADVAGSRFLAAELTLDIRM